jgi:tetratricopeptide (TPR) repeat protein
MREVRTKQPLSASSAEAARLYQEAVDRMLASLGGAGERLDRALASAPDFAPAAAARYVVASDAREPDAARFRIQAEEAATRAAAWERQHVTILVGLTDRPSESVEQAREHVARYPADLLVIAQLSSHLFFHGGPGKRHAVLELLRSAEPALADDWAFLARLGFAESENGERRQGRKLLERALAARPDALYSIHGMAHVLHDDGDIGESAALLQEWLHDHENEARGGSLYGHIQWHLALKEWQRGEESTALRRFEKHCSPGTTSCGPVLSLADCGGFLLRRFLVDGTTRPLAGGVTDLIEHVWGMIGHPFVALNVAGLYLAAGDDAGLRRCREAIAESPGGTYHDLSAAIIEAMGHFAADDFQAASRVLASLSPEQRVGVGGSNVERELIELVEQAARARLRDCDPGN